MIYDIVINILKTHPNFASGKESMAAHNIASLLTKALLPILSNAIENGERIIINQFDKLSGIIYLALNDHYGNDYDHKDAADNAENYLALYLCKPETYQKQPNRDILKLTLNKLNSVRNPLVFLKGNGIDDGVSVTAAIQEGLLFAEVIQPGFIEYEPYEVAAMLAAGADPFIEDEDSFLNYKFAANAMMLNPVISGLNRLRLQGHRILNRLLTPLYQEEAEAGLRMLHFDKERSEHYGHNPLLRAIEFFSATGSAASQLIDDSSIDSLQSGCVLELCQLLSDEPNPLSYRTYFCDFSKAKDINDIICILANEHPALSFTDNGKMTKKELAKTLLAQIVNKACFQAESNARVQDICLAALSSDPSKAELIVLAERITQWSDLDANDYWPRCNSLFDNKAATRVMTSLKLDGKNDDRITKIIRDYLKSNDVGVVSDFAASCDESFMPLVKERMFKNITIENAFFINENTENTVLTLYHLETRMPGALKDLDLHDICKRTTACLNEVQKGLHNALSEDKVREVRNTPSVQSECDVGFLEGGMRL